LLPEDKIAENYADGDKSSVRNDPVVALRWLESLEMQRIGAQLLTFSATVTVRIAEQIHIRIGVSSDESEEWSEGIAAIVADVSAFAASTGRVADEKLGDKGWDDEEGVEEWSGDDTAPVVAD